MTARPRNASGFVRRDALHQWSMRFGPNMTPMVDVVMVILIFFMASAAFMGEEWFLRAAIPAEAASGKAAAKPQPMEMPPPRIDILLDVDDAGHTTASSVTLQLERGPLDRVIDRISAFPKGEITAPIEVLIKPTPRVPYRDVVRVHESCEAVGITKVGIGVTREAAPAATPITP